MAGVTDQPEIRPPFRIMPSRRRNLIPPGTLALVGVALVAGSIWSGSGLASIGLFVGIFLVPIGLLWFWRERQYFDPGSAYWIEIGIDDFALVTPYGNSRSKWSELTPFEVKQVVTEYEFNHRRAKSVTIETVTYRGGAEIKIPLDDFATRLGAERHQRAEAMRVILGDLRQNGLNRQNAEAAGPFPIPTGLVVASMPSPKRSIFAAVKSVVQRQ